MASTSYSNNNNNAGISITRPPIFDGVNFSYWKNRMMIWICSQDQRIWNVIEEGNYIPTKKDTQKVGDVDVEKEIPKTKKEYTEDDWKRIAFNYKAINFLHYGLNQDDYLKISTCTTAKEIWDKLVITFEGTDHVKKSKISTLTREYQLFKMQEGE